MVRLFLSALALLLPATTVATGMCPGGQFEVSLLGSGTVYCIDDPPCSGNYVPGQEIGNSACPGQGLISVHGKHQIIAPTCCGIINTDSNVIGCVFQSSQFKCVGPTPAPVSTFQPIPSVNPGLKEANVDPTLPPTTIPITTTPQPITTTSTPSTTIAPSVPNTTIIPIVEATSSSPMTTTLAPSTLAPTVSPDTIESGSLGATTVPTAIDPTIQYPASQTWLLEDNITSLSINAPGRVFVNNWTQWLKVNAEPTSEYQMAAIVISGTSLNSFQVLNISDASNALIQMFNVTTNGENGLIINFERHIAEVIDGQILIEIYVRYPVVTRVSVQGDAETFIEPSVVQGSNLELSTGDGNMVATINQKNITSLDLHTTGSGFLQLSAQYLRNAEAVNAQVDASGDVIYFAGKLTARNFTSVTSGSGDIHIYSTKLDIKNLTSHVLKSGNIVFGSGSGVCKYHNVEVSGSGSVESGRILCFDAWVKVSYTGRGDALVQVSNQIQTDVRGPGNVLYYNTTPRLYPAYKKHFFRADELKSNISDIKIMEPFDHEAREFHIGKPEGNSWLGSLSALDLDRIILYGCILFVVIAGIIAGSKWYNIYKTQKQSRGEYQPLQ